MSHGDGIYIYIFIYLFVNLFVNLHLMTSFPISCCQEDGASSHRVRLLGPALSSAPPTGNGNHTTQMVMTRDGLLL